MRLYEIVTSAYYIGTKAKQKVGAIINLQGDVHPLGALLEHQLEQRRPDDQLPRDKSLYLHRHPDENAEYTYEIEPIGQIDRHHTSWLKRLAAVNTGNEGEVDQLVHGYWSGKEYPEMRDEPWEYRTLEAKVLKRTGGTAIDDHA